MFFSTDILFSSVVYFAFCLLVIFDFVTHLTMRAGERQKKIIRRFRKQDYFFLALLQWNIFQYLTVTLCSKLKLKLKLNYGLYYAFP